jgi:regulator of protease activity HflC (stomatin/prohibitin superfamily)
LNLRWRIDPLKLVSIHKTVREDIEEKIIRPVVMRVVKDEATRLTAIDAYSGEGLVRLQTSIQSSLTGAERGEGKELSERGIIVENFVIEHIKLDDKYIEEIKGKQIATQKTLRAVEEQKAAEAKALVAKSEAMAEYNTKLVAQQLLSTNMVIQAGAENERVIIAAKAQAEQVTIAAKAAAEQVMVAAKAQAAQVELAANAEKTKLELEGEGKKLAMVAVADGTLAMGKADAAAKQLLVESYKGAGQDAYVQIQVAQSLAEGTKSIQGYLPNNFNPTVISENFVNAIQSVLGSKVPSAVASK